MTLFKTRNKVYSKKVYKTNQFLKYYGKDDYRKILEKIPSFSSYKRIDFVKNIIFQNELKEYCS